MVGRALLPLLLLPSLARGNEPPPLYTCKPLSPPAKVRVSLAPGSTLADAVTWVVGFTCKNVVYPTDLKVRVTIVSPNEMTPKEAYQLFLDTLPVYGVAVKENGNNVILTATAAADSSADAELQAEMANGIKRVDDTHATISRALLDKLLADPNLVARSARIVPSIKDGKANGFKLYAIRPTSLWAQLGLQNGDTLHAVDGLELTSPDKALEVYKQVKGAKTHKLDLVRRGQAASLEITVLP